MVVLKKCVQNYLPATCCKVEAMGPTYSSHLMRHVDSNVHTLFIESSFQPYERV